MTGSVAITLFVVGVIVAIMIHEWGHFATARAFGMRADRFFLGFGPTLWSRRVGETEYGVKLLPLGGFVRIKGMSPLDERLEPVPDAALDPEVLAELRRATAEASGRDLLEEPAVPVEPVGDRLAELLAERGVPSELRERIVGRFVGNLRPDHTPAEARQLLVEVVSSEIPDTGRVGDLHHRVMRGDAERFFADRPAWQRAIVLVSGSFMHFVQAAVLLFLGFALFGPQQPVPVIEDFAAAPNGVSAAEEAGLEPGDRIVAVDGITSDDFGQLRQIIRERPGIATEVVVDRDGEELAFTITPEPVVDEETGERFGLLGFRPGVREVPLPADEALYETFLGESSVTVLTVETVKALGRVFGPEGIGAMFDAMSGETDRADDGGVSLVGAAQITGEGTAALGPFFLFAMLATVNVFVGIFNILPLPPLDGGHLAVLGVERSVNAVRRARGRAADFSIDPRAVAAIAVPVIVLVGTISVVLLWLDITNPVRIGQ
jgi:regulator of sigma E protease